MSAVAATAAPQMPFHVRKTLPQPGIRIPHTQLTHTGRIDDDSAGGKSEQLPVRGGVTAFGCIHVAGDVDAHYIFACEVVDEA